jgi:hypothetical protein
MPLSRRSFVRGIAAVAGFALATPAPAQLAQAPARFSSVSVDVSVLHAKGLGAYADLLGSAVLAETRRAFADRIGGGGPRLVVRLTGVYLAAYSGGGSGRFGGTAQNTDSLEGEALIVGRRGEILARFPQLSATSAASGGPWYDPVRSEHRRTIYLAQHYAQWLRRRIG